MGGGTLWEVLRPHTGKARARFGGTRSETFTALCISKTRRQYVQSKCWGLVKQYVVQKSAVGKAISGHSTPKSAMAIGHRHSGHTCGTAPGSSLVFTYQCNYRQGRQSIRDRGDASPQSLCWGGHQLHCPPQSWVTIPATILTCFGAKQ